MHPRVRAQWITLALAGLLMVSSALPALGARGKADHPARYSACAGQATASAGFRDMKGHFAESAADCLAFFGITQGTSAGYFSPDRPVTRLQMALFPGAGGRAGRDPVSQGHRSGVHRSRRLG